MCDQERVRYVHVMEHEDHPDQLRCGCVCAGHMEGDLAAAWDRQESLKCKLKADARWLNRGWKRSQAGNEYRKEDGTLVIIFGRAGRWGYQVKSADGRAITRRNLPSSKEPSSNRGSCCCVTDRIWKDTQ